MCGTFCWHFLVEPDFKTQSLHFITLPETKHFAPENVAIFPKEKQLSSNHHISGGYGHVGLWGEKQSNKHYYPHLIASCAVQHICSNSCFCKRKPPETSNTTLQPEPGIDQEMRICQVCISRNSEILLVQSVLAAKTKSNTNHWRSWGAYSKIKITGDKSMEQTTKDTFLLILTHRKTSRIFGKNVWSTTLLENCWQACVVFQQAF